MNRIVMLLVAALVGGAAVYFLVPRHGPDSGQDELRRAFSRASAFYRNETSQDYRRARLELQPFAERLADSIAYRLDMALIDLAELNQPVQDEARNLGGPPNEQLLLQSALDHLERARAIAPNNEAVLYNLARTYRKLAPRAQNSKELREAARGMLAGLVKGDDPDPGALFYFAETLQEMRRYEESLAAYERLVKMGRDFMLENQFVVGQHGRAALINRLKGDASEVLRVQKEYGSPDPKRLALESGRYTRFLPLTAAPTVKPDPRAMEWRQTTSRTLLPEAGTPRFFLAPDLDNDCRRDLVFQTTAGMRIYRARRSGAYDDLTEAAGLPLDFAVHAAAAGDLDNDGRADLVVGGPQGLRLFVNTTLPEKRTKWTFQDRTDRLPGAGAPVSVLVLWDLDHDGDVDIFVGGPQGNRVYRTVVEQPAPGKRELAFTEIAEQLTMRQPAATHALMIDVEDDDDTDLLVNDVWFENLRQLSFRKNKLPAAGAFAAADVDNDLLEEVAIGRAVYKWRDGAWTRLFDRDALLDLDGDGVIDADPFAGIALRGALRHAVGADLNRDGHRDLLVMTDAGLDQYMSRPKRPAGWIDIMPRGLKANEFGIATKVRLFSGDLSIGATCRDGLLSFGLGRRTVVDAVMLRWTNGVEQGEVQPRLAACIEIEEREGEVGSCPFLYAFDGTRWHFVNDCHSGTPLGLPYADGKYLPPRPTETIFVPGHQLKVVDGKLRLDLAEEFRELFYVDSVVLRAIDHPKHVRPVLNEGFKVFARPEFKVYPFTNLVPPRRAVDHKGRDITELVSKRDERHAVVFEKLDSRYVGLAAKWTIELDFGPAPNGLGGPAFLVMDGWVEFPTASASIASAQAKTVMFMPPVIEALGKDGQWKVVEKDPGFPAGKGKAVLVDLTGKLETGRIRISSTQRIHWDAFWFSQGLLGPMTLTPLPIASATHAFRGIGRRVDEPGQPWRYSHDDLVSFYTYDQLPAGLLTKYGDVKELLDKIDDRYPVLASGDVVHLEFDAKDLPPLKEGWVRDWCFTTQGWVKDADMNQAVRERVKPLPFRAMPGYPYDEAEVSHPHPDWVSEWFTRPARRLVNPEALRETRR